MQAAPERNKEKEKLHWGFLLLPFLTAVVFGIAIAFDPQRSTLLITGGLIVLLVLALSFRFESLPFNVFVASLVLEDVLKVPGLPSPVMTVFGGLAIVAWLLRLLTGRARFVVDFKSTLLVFLLAVWASVSAIHGGGISAALTARPYWLVFILFILVQNYLHEEWQFAQLGWALAISLASAGLLIFGEQILTYINAGGKIAAQALHYNANHNITLQTDSGIWGMRITKGLPFAIYLSTGSFGNNLLRKLLLYCCILFMILGPISTLSINAVVGLMATIGVIVLLTKNRVLQIRALILGILVLCLIAYSPLVDRINAQRSTFASSDYFSWATERGLTWYTGYQIIRQAPVFGVGPTDTAILNASWNYLPTDVKAEKLLVGKEGVQPHNLILSFGAQLGIPGLLIFIVLLYIVLIRLWSVIRWQWRVNFDKKYTLWGQALLVGLIALLIQSMAISVPLDKYLWLILGASVAYIRLLESARNGLAKN